MSRLTRAFRRFDREILRPAGQVLGLSDPNLPAENRGRNQASPYDPGAAQFDSTGRPIGAMPGSSNALEWQYEADRRTEQRRQALWGDAQNVMRQGSDLMQTYRPGGSAALASGIFQNRASMYGTQAMNTESPDLMMGYRERQQQKADAERKQSQRLNTIMQIAGFGVGVAGALMGGKKDEQAPQVPGSPEAAPGLMGGGSAPASAQTGAGVSGLGGMFGGQMGMAPSQQAASGQPLAAMMQQDAPSTGGPSTEGASGGIGGQPGMVGSAGSAAKKGGRGGGAPGQPGASAGLAGSGMMAAGMPGPMSMFSSQEAATAAMMANQDNGPIYQEWAESPIRNKSTMDRVLSAQLRVAQSYYPA